MRADLRAQAEHEAPTGGHLEVPARVGHGHGTPREGDGDAGVQVDAGGVDALSRKRTDSVRVAWDNVLKWAPEVMIVSPCGFNLNKVLEHTPQLFHLPDWQDLPAVSQGRVYAIDANSYFARPGPRVIDGTELLAHLIHPELFSWKGAQDAFQRLTPIH